MIYFCCILGGFSFYLWLQLEAIKKKIASHIDTLAFIIELIEPSEPNEKLKPYELRSIISQNKLSIIEIKKELTRVEEIAMQAINNVGSIIRHSKQHPISPDAINKFIVEQGLLKDESPPKSN
jgi:hypothetical protein